MAQGHLPKSEISQMVFNNPGSRAQARPGALRHNEVNCLPGGPGYPISPGPGLQLSLVPHSYLKCHARLSFRRWSSSRTDPWRYHVLCCFQNHFSLPCPRPLPQPRMPADGTHFHPGNPLRVSLSSQSCPRLPHLNIVGTPPFFSLFITVLVQATTGSAQNDFKARFTDPSTSSLSLCTCFLHYNQS